MFSHSSNNKPKHHERLLFIYFFNFKLIVVNISCIFFKVKQNAEICLFSTAQYKCVVADLESELLFFIFFFFGFASNLTTKRKVLVALVFMFLLKGIEEITFKICQVFRNFMSIHTS